MACAGDLLTTCIEVEGELARCTLGLASARGIAVLEAADGTAVQVVSGADVRRLVRRRLDAPGGARRADLRGVVRRVRAARCGSAIESDLVFLEVTRELAGGVHRAVTERWVGWFAHIDPESAAPRWVKASTREIDAGRFKRGWLVGPFADKHAAAKAVETLDYLFDLCRYPRELEKSPGGTACAYKGMGLCPAACDGSEPVAALQGRAAASAGAVGAGLIAWRETNTAEMERAAAGQDFERAELLKRKLEKSEDLESRGMAWAGRAAEMAWLIVAPGVRTGWARVVVVGGCGWCVVGDAREGCTGEALARAVREGGDRVIGDPRGVGGRADVVGLMSWWAYRAAAERGCEMTMIGARGIDGEWLGQAIERCLRGTQEGRERDGHDSGEDRVIECGGAGRG